jgi:hypothetical protein
MKELLLKLFGWIPIPKPLARLIISLLPKRYKRNLVRNFIDGIKENPEIMSALVSKIIETLEVRGYDSKKGREFKTTEEEVDRALDEVPSLKPYKIYLVRWCERKRREAGLSL